MLQKRKLIKPEKEIRVQYNYMDVQDWCLQEGIWTEDESRKLWHEMCEYGDVSNGGSCSPGQFTEYYDNEDEEEVELNNIVVKMFEALDEDDFSQSFWVDW